MWLAYVEAILLDNSVQAGSVSIADGSKLGDAWLQLVLGNPEVQASGAHLRALSPVLAQVLTGTYMYCCGESYRQDHKWPVLLDAGRLREVFRYHCKCMQVPDYNLREFFVLGPKEKELIGQAAEALAAQNRKFYDFLRGSQPRWVALGTSSQGTSVEINPSQWDRRDLLLDPTESNLWGRDGEGGDSDLVAWRDALACARIRATLHRR